MDLSFYLVASKDKLSEEKFLNILKEAVKGGVCVIQLREKNLCARDFYKLAMRVKALCDELKTTLIINDRVDIALAVNACGVHLGQDDLPLKEARKLLGNEKIIGISAKTKEQIDEAYKFGATYVGCGAIYKSLTKDSSVIGLKGLNELTSHIKEKKYSLKTVAIGGIKDENILSFKGMFVNSLAFSSAIMQSENVYQTCLDIKNKLEAVLSR
ncbi:MAG TPA: thiamine phosphate synthase [Campylobacter avium]|uniref:thiamine phosphate synthase n=1 Tax=Campylobacter avium TaxID=522485 RepID=UPI001DBA822C|nr:thiamine phosphate synthase [Campylobacter avium]HJE65531.1 thiamine phosphate synthase [Campylobacter avium]